MKLKHVRLAGFKSFADAETLVFPGAITGIVGPNGCGKSNVVDAIRWVMGETSRHIRAATLDDVVFNGAAARKPAGLATVEVVFDNSDGSVGGQYAAYAEISVRRTVNSDRESRYYLNGSPCRRRDVKTLMRGTGLAGNSYAIMEQGMVSRLIEAHPEEVRGYIEEAAEITGYKDRRRESEARMKRTRENLDRVLDIRDEVAKQLRKLKRQIREAERFTGLKREKRRLELEINMLRQRELQKEMDALNAVYTEARAAKEGQQQALRGVEEGIEEARSRLADARARLDAARERMYEHSAAMMNARRDVQVHRDGKRQLESERAEVAAGLDAAETEVRELRERSETLAASNTTLTERAKVLEAGIETLKRNIARNADMLKEVDVLLQKRRRETHALNETLKVEKARIAMYDDEIKRLTEAESEQIQHGAGGEINELEERTQQQKEAVKRDRAALAAATREFDDVDKAIVSLDEKISRATAGLHEQQALERELQGRLESLNALQEESLRKKDEVTEAWLDHHGLASRQRLADQIEADPRWETAVEIVLANFFSAIEVGSLDEYADACMRFTGSALELVERSAESTRAAGTLAEKVTGSDALNDVLGRISMVESLGEALSRRARLREGESLITCDGFWLGPRWLRLYRPGRENEGVLLRRHRVEDIRRELSERKETNCKRAGELEDMRSRRIDKEDTREKLRSELNDLRTRVATLEAALLHQEELLRHKHEASRKAAQRLTGIQRRLTEVRAARAASGQTIADTGRQISVIDGRYGDPDADKLSCTERIRRFEEELERAQAQLRNAEVSSEAARVGSANAREHVARLERQIEGFRRHRASINESLAVFDEPGGVRAQRLEQLQQNGLVLERERAEIENKVGQLDENIKELEARRRAASDEAEKTQSRMNETQVALQVAQSRYAAERSVIDEQGGKEMELDEAATLEGKQAELNAVQEKMDGLGAINLAAMDEFAELNERGKYLDAQHDDLVEAMRSLRQAISKMDEESERRFKETLDKINAELDGIFPRLFNGGRAYLKMVGGDYLSDGVAVMVKPQGKRLARINLLSGGEKALAAAAVLFSIFALKPAPFCVLDEVDAPLDDHNVDQLWTLLREMSGETQFIVVTHNKSGMEYADTLIGVTMQEPGVTRLVSVNVDDVAAQVETV